MKFLNAGPSQPQLFGMDDIDVVLRAKCPVGGNVGVTRSSRSMAIERQRFGMDDIDVVMGAKCPVGGRCEIQWPMAIERTSPMSGGMPGWCPTRQVSAKPAEPRRKQSLSENRRGSPHSTVFLDALERDATRNEPTAGEISSTANRSVLRGDNQHEIIADPDAHGRSGCCRMETRFSSHNGSSTHKSNHNDVRFGHCVCLRETIPEQPRRSTGRRSNFDVSTSNLRKPSYFPHALRAPTPSKRSARDVDTISPNWTHVSDRKRQVQLQRNFLQPAESTHRQATAHSQHRPIWKWPDVGTRIDSGVAEPRAFYFARVNGLVLAILVDRPTSDIRSKPSHENEEDAQGQQASSGYSLEKYMVESCGWTKDEFAEVQARVQELAEGKLDVNLSFQKQVTSALLWISEAFQVKKEFPVTRGYEQCWPIRDMLKVYLKSTSEAYRRRRTKVERS
ncbi:hypothetical protein C8R46DRAFT_1029357 [Mycena filopes]|nr:hypothetical protein C8R46DRAFT_1029357 [Mycena filopes]